MAHSKDSKSGKGRFAASWLLKRHGMDRINWDPPSAEKPGYLRGMHNGSQARKAFAKLVSFPHGQKTPTHSASADHMIFGVRGQVQFHLPDGSFPIDENDPLYFPVTARYRFENVGSADAQFLSIVSESQNGWPPQSEYWDADA